MKTGAAVLLLALTPLLTLAQEGPGRVAYPSLIEGVVQVSDANNPDGRNLTPNQALPPGSRLNLSPGARLELSQGSSTWRAEGPALIELSALDDNSSQTLLRRGKLDVRVRRLEAGERLEIDTPNLAVLVQQAGAYRLDVDPDSGQTRVSVGPGSLVAYGEQGQALSLPAGLQWTFQGRQLSQVGRPAVPRTDNFDLWTQSRQQQEDQSLSARYVPRELIGYQQLDGWGDWQNDPSLGPVWYPQLNNPDWAPYRYGQWQWIEPWGWTWVDDAPWGFAPFHYGRWVVSSRGWGWVPGRYERRPVYSPALVGFIGQPQRGGAGHHRQPGVAWVPLAPGENWRPGTPVGPHNPAAGQGRDRRPDNGYAHQYRPGGMTQQAQSGGHGWSRPSAGANDALPMPKPFIQVQPGGGSSVMPPANNDNGRLPRGPEAQRPSLNPQPAFTPSPPAGQRPQPPGQVTAVPNTAPRSEQERVEREQAQQREQAQRLQLNMGNSALQERQRQEQQQWQQHQLQMQQQQQQLQQQQWQRQQQVEQERQRQEAAQREQVQREQVQREQQMQQQRQQQERQQQERWQQERQQQERLHQQQLMQQQLQQQQQQQFQQQQPPQRQPGFSRDGAPGREGGPSLRPQQVQGPQQGGTPVGPRLTPPSTAPNTQ